MKSFKILKIPKIQTVIVFYFQGLTFFSIFDLKTWWFMLMMQTTWHFQIFGKGSFFCTKSTLCSLEITRVQRFPFHRSQGTLFLSGYVATFGRFLFTGAAFFETSTWLRSLRKIYEQNIGNEKKNIPQWESLLQGVTQFVFLCVLCFMCIWLGRGFGVFEDVSVISLIAGSR